MGIPSYFSYILKNHSNILCNLQIIRNNIGKGGAPFDSLYMDCNSIIYDALKKEAITTEKEIIEFVIQKIKYYIQYIRPTKLAYIAFDGVAPFAKMEQQRTRRYKGAFMSTINFENSETTPEKSPVFVSLPQTEENRETSPPIKFNSCAITSGTLFMEYLAREIEYAFLPENKEETGKLKIITSTSNDYGEGEHKMFEYMRENVDENETVAVYGLDADLIMLSIFHSLMCKNIYIFREAPEFSLKVLPRKLYGLRETGEPIFINIMQFIRCILKEMNCRTFDAGRIYDYVFMCFMLGNDFLPHFPALNIRTTGINHLMDTYDKVISPFTGRYFISTTTSKIQWKWVSVFIKELAKNEHDYILYEYDMKARMAERCDMSDKTAKQREALFDNIPIIYRADELYICPEEDGWRIRYYKMAFGEENVDDDFLKKVCVNYLEGLEWVFKYYTEGCPHWRWKYHYNYPPLLCDLVKYIPMFETDFLNKICDTVPNVPFHPISQLVYVLPRVYHYLLPKHVQTKINSQPVDILQKYFPSTNELKFKWMFCRYFWETHLELPEMTMEILDTYATTET